MRAELTFIMPVYNGKKYIRDAVNSIYNTVHGIRWELLLCDDCSNDGSKRLIQQYARRHEVKAIYNNSNVGAGEARNKLFEIADSDVFFCLDCDNILTPRLVNNLWKMIRDGKDVACPQRIDFFGFSHPTKVDSHWDFSGFGEKIDLKDMLVSFNVSPCSGNYMYRRKVFDAVGGYHTEDIQETWGFGFRHVAAGYPCWLCPGTSYLHRFCRDGYYNRLPHDKMDVAFWNNLNRIRDRLTPETAVLLDEQKDGREIIKSGKLRLR